MSDQVKVKTEPCDECGVDTLSLLKERDQLRAEVDRLKGELDDRTHKANTFSAQLNKVYRQLEDSQAALETERAKVDALRKVLEKAIDQVFSEQTSLDGENRTAWVWQEANKVLESLTPPTIEQKGSK